MAVTDNDAELDSEDQKEIVTLQSLPPDAFIAFFKKEGHYQKCHICGTADWSVLGRDGAPSAITLETFEGGGTFGLAYALTCGRCGHMRFVNAKAVLASLERDDKE